MLKMGQMCHCGKTVALVGEDGQVIWKRYRPKRVSIPSDGCLLFDPASDRLYTFGSNAVGNLSDNTDDGYVTCYGDATTANPSVLWHSQARPTFANPTDANANNIGNKMLLADDGYLWAGGASTIGRFDPDTGEEVAQWAFGTALFRMFPGTGGAVVLLIAGGFGGGNNLRRIDSSAAVTHTDSVAYHDLVKVGSDFVVANFATFGGPRYSKVNETLATLGTYNPTTAGEPLGDRFKDGFALHALGNYFVSDEGDGSTGIPSSISLYDATGMTRVWKNTTNGLNSTVPVTERQWCNDGTYLYNSFTLQHIKLTAAVGTQLFNITASIPQAYPNAHSTSADADRFVCGISVGISAILRSFDAADGSEEWSAVWNENDAGQRSCWFVDVVPGVGIFCCGKFSNTGF